MLGAPHDPCRGTGGGTGEGEELDACVVAEGFHGNDAVLDGGGCSSADCEGAEHFEDAAEDHCSAVCYGAGGDRGSPSVGDIV